MALKPAVGAVEAHLRWPEDRLRETEEQRHPDQHDADGEQPPEGTRHRDVAKTRRCQRRHGEIERVEVAIDLGLAAVMQGKDQTRRYEEEDREGQEGEDKYLVATATGGCPPEVAQH